MNRLKKINVNNLIMLFIIMQPIIDIITSLLVRNVSSTFTLGIFVRTIFMISIVLYAFFNSEKSYRTKMLIYYGAIFIYSIIFLFTMYKENGTNMIFAQIKGLVKTFYFPIVLVALYPLMKQKKIEVEDKTFIYALLGYTLTIFLAKIFNIAYPTYSIGLNVGTTGLFFAANEIGIVMAILVIFLFNNLFLKKVDNIKDKIIYIVSLFLYVYSILEMGTKVPILGFIGMIAIIFIICIIRFFTVEKKFYLKKIVELVTLMTIIGILLPYTAVGINVEKNYGIKFFKLSNSVQEGKVEEKQEKVEEPPKKFNNTEEVTTAVVSSRNLFLKMNLDLYKNSSFINKIVGIGYVDNSEGQFKDIKTIEIDYFDIFILQGIFGAILFFIPIAVILFLILKKSILNLKNIIKNEDVLTMYTMLGLAACVAMLAGHTFVAPAVSIYIAFIFNKLLNKVEEIEK